MCIYTYIYTFIYTQIKHTQKNKQVWLCILRALSLLLLICFLCSATQVGHCIQSAFVSFCHRLVSLLSSPVQVPSVCVHQLFLWHRRSQWSETMSFVSATPAQTTLHIYLTIYLSISVCVSLSLSVSVCLACLSSTKSLWLPKACLLPGWSL